jgi:hypothetical protein
MRKIPSTDQRLIRTDIQLNDIQDQNYLKPLCHNDSNLIFIPTKKYDLPSIMLSNITGALSSKIPEIKEIADQHFIDIICITETWCSVNIPDSTIYIPGFILYRRDRKDGRACGGIALYIREHLTVSYHWSELDVIDLESLWLTLRPRRLPRGVSHFTISLIYHPPKADDWVMNQHIINSMDKIKQKYPMSQFNILGDFNHMKDTYIKNTCQIKQLVKQPTHGKSVIDLFYSTNTEFYTSPLHIPGIGLSKHNTLIFIPCFKQEQEHKIKSITKRNQSAKNRNNLKTAVNSISWDNLYRAKTCSDKFTIFSSILENLIDKHLPFHTVQRNVNDLPWVTDRFRHLIKLRQFHFHSGNTVMFKLFRNKVNRERKKLKSEFVKTTMDDLKQINPKDWWKKIKLISGQNSGSDSLINMVQSECNGDYFEFASKVNVTFKNVSDHLVPLQPLQNNESTIPDKFILLPHIVESQLSKLNCNKSQGPDDIPTWLLKDMSHVFGPVVSSIWNASLRENYIPKIWKSANTCALPKVTHPKNMKKDLRPISLTPILSKGIEFHVREWFMGFIKDDIDKWQYGSLKNCSTVIALAQLIHEWLLALETSNNVIRILLLDFQKAFDLVDHNILMAKICDKNIPTFLQNWIYSFLEGRRQRVKLNNEVSPWLDINGGVPQGTLLGPVTFLLHINDLKTDCHSIKYVDDTTIWEACSTDLSNSKIQIASNQVTSWCQQNNMKINVDKTKEMVIYFGKKNFNISPICMDGRDLERVECTKLLGVMINNKLTWGDHVDYICGKVSKRLYFLRLLKRSNLPPSDIMQVYCSIIRSVLEYACEIWHPSITVQQTKQLETIQKRACLIAYPDISYEMALRACNLTTLFHRREERCKQFFKEICEPEHKLHHLLPPANNNVRCLRTTRQYNIPKVKTNRLKNSPIYYGIFNFQFHL